MHPSYAVVQTLLLLTVATSVVAPVSLLVSYFGAFDVHAGAEEFFEMYRTRKLMTMFICAEIVLTRIWVLVEAYNMVAMADGLRLTWWGSSMRFMWFTGAVLEAFAIDVGTMVWVIHAKDVCAVGNLSARQEAALRALCHHSINIGVTVKIALYVNAAVTVALYASILWWWAVNNMGRPLKNKRV